MSTQVRVSNLSEEEFEERIRAAGSMRDGECFSNFCLRVTYPFSSLDRQYFSFTPSIHFYKICLDETEEFLESHTYEAFHASYSQCMEKKALCIHHGLGKRVYYGHHKIGECPYSVYRRRKKENV